jgi:2-hydroxy-3-keto-5-methylthiopentenyl-1-phosphate phosphatase
MKLALQCDFDGTITEEDVSFLLLDTFVGEGWRDILRKYMGGQMPVGAFNREVFGMIKADEQTQLDVIFNSDRVKIRPGLKELVDYCETQGHRFLIVSNGLTFYIKALLGSLGLDHVDVYAARNVFHPAGMDVSYIGPEGNEMEVGFKEAYTNQLIKDGYSVAYAGNGVSDIYPARLAVKVFATGDLPKKCREENLEYTHFEDLYEIIRGLETL